MPDCEKCPYLSRIERLEQDMDKNRESHSEFWDRINTLDKKGDLNLQKIIQALDSIKGVDAKIDKLSDQITKLVSAPSENWNTITKTTITAVVSAIVGAVMMLILK